MPALSSDAPLSVLPNNTTSSFDLPSRKSNDKTISGVFTYTNGTDVETGLPDHRLEQIKNLRSGSQTSLAITNANVKSGRDRAPSTTGSTVSGTSKPLPPTDYFTSPPPSHDPTGRTSTSESGPEATRMNGSAQLHSHSGQIPSAKPLSLRTQSDVDSDRPDATSSAQEASAPRSRYMSSPPAMTPIESNEEPRLEPIKPGEPARLQQRHTLNVPHAASGAARASRDFSYTSGPSEEVLQSSGRFSPTRDQDGNVVRRRRASLGLVRRSTRATSSAAMEDVPLDEDAARWTEVIRAKRASRRKRLEEEDDDRVVVGKKVQEGDANFVTAYMMLAGIRFTVSRANAKIMDGVTDADFDVKDKKSFDVTGSEQTPGSKYDFKFKDYCPQVFRHLRQIFGLDPADYLMSLTSKYILSELGSPGKSGSLFYYSRDYKYVIKTVHHAEHKLLRRILRDYYNHVKDNPNTLISQFYGLHRVKVAYGRKIHFLVMNNLFPPHRDIHQRFDLKGSTVGREFKEEGLEANPRATLKDLNWLRRDMHLEFDQRLRQVFIEQLQRDVTLLQRLQIMDYSLLVGIHDLGKGNDDNVREQTLQVFQPGGEQNEDDLPGHLMRTPSRLENAKKARELRQNLRREKPVPMGQSMAKMPENIGADDQRRLHIFYNEDGGIRATHEDGRAADTIYYLGVIDCLTHYGFVKRIEHFWKGLSNNRHQISPIPPHAYGERFLNFMTGITMTKEEAQRRADQEGNIAEKAEVNGRDSTTHHDAQESATVDGKLNGRIEIPPHSPRNELDVERTLEAAQKSTDKQTGEKGRRSSEEEKPERTLLTHTDGGRISTTLPVVRETQENGSSHVSSRNSRADSPGETDQANTIPDSGVSMREEASDHEQQIEYTVTDDNGHHFGHRKKYHMHAPLGAQTLDNPGPEVIQDPSADSDSRRISKPPRIGSGILPPFSPMYGEDEIGIAR